MDLAVARQIVDLHDVALMDWHVQKAAQSLGDHPPARAEDAFHGLEEVVCAQHEANYNLWGLEDRARREDVDDAYIVAVKRAIDAWNQRRNDLIEAIDEQVLATLPAPGADGAEQHSETVGMMIDRLSILSLKIYHMRANAERAAASDAGLAAECETKLTNLRDQRKDLAACLSRFVEEARAGRRYFKPYHQHKAYNDPRLRGGG